MLHHPTLKQLRHLIALNKEGSFSKAAKLCSVTQSTLSASIAELEAILGVKLAERTRKFQGPTDVGIEVIKRGKEILALTDDLVNFTQSQQEPLTGKLRLGAIPTIGPFLLPQLVSNLQKKYQKLTLFLYEGQTLNLLDMLAEGKIDAALLAFPYPTKNLEIEFLGLDKMQLLVPKGDPLARHNHISLDALLTQNLLLLEDGHCLRDHVLDVCKLEGSIRPESYEGTSLLTLALMVEMKLGVTLIPNMAIKAGLLKGLEVELVPIGNEKDGRDIGLAWRKSSPRGEEFKLLSEELKKPF